MAQTEASSPSTTVPLVVSPINLTRPPLNQLLNQVTSIETNRSNCLPWQNLVWPILKSYKQEGYLTGEKPCPENVGSDGSSSAGQSAATPVGTGQQPNPAYEAWIAVDQLLLGRLVCGDASYPLLIMKIKTMSNFNLDLRHSDFQRICIYRYNLSVEEVAELARRTIYHATFQDGASVYYVGPNGWKKLSGDDVGELHYKYYLVVSDTDEQEMVEVVG